MKTKMPRKKGWLAVDNQQEIYWQEYGNSKGKPVLFLHGGPGCGFDAGYLKLFDLKQIRFITFDQRGTGRSRPLGCVRANTTNDLLHDIEAIRKHLCIPTWFVTGHSWGTTLALLYASQHLSVVKGIMLAGFFSARRKDHIWCLEGVSSFFPDLHEKLMSELQIKFIKNIDLKIGNLMKKGSYTNRRKTAKALSNYFRQLTSLAPAPPKKGPVSLRQLAMWDVFFHYAKNNFWLNPEEGVYPFVSNLTSVPITLVHGRYDMDCLPEQAFELKKRLPHLELILTNGNHDLEEEPMLSAYKEALCAHLANLSVLS